jgi:hypothetical protein
MREFLSFCTTIPRQKCIRGPRFSSFAGAAKFHSRQVNDIFRFRQTLQFIGLEQITGNCFDAERLHAFALNQVDSTKFDFISSASQLRLEIKSGIAKGSRLAVLGSDFPELRSGLQNIWRRVSPVFAVEVYPAPGPVTGFLSLYYNADSLQPNAADALIIHRWNNNQWVPVPTTFDSRQSFASTPFPGPGIYTAYLDPSKSVLTGIEADAAANTPLQFKLKQNFPNPFNPETQIEFSLPVRQRVVLKIYDVMGRQVRVLLDEVRDAGNHHIVFNATTLASGVYFYQLRAGDRVAVHKMLLIR